MTAVEVIRQIEAMSSAERARVFEWMRAMELEEPPEILTALDAATSSANERGATPVDEVRKLLQSWASKSD